MRVNLFIVHDAAREVALPPKVPGGPAPKRFQWMAVARGQCKKGCQVRQERFHILHVLLAVPAPNGFRERKRHMHSAKRAKQISRLCRTLSILVRSGGATCEPSAFAEGVHHSARLFRAS